MAANVVISVVHNLLALASTETIAHNLHSGTVATVVTLVHTSTVGTTALVLLVEIAGNTTTLHVENETVSTPAVAVGSTGASTTGDTSYLTMSTRTVGDGLADTMVALAVTTNKVESGLVCFSSSSDTADLVFAATALDWSINLSGNNLLASVQSSVDNVSIVNSTLNGITHAHLLRVVLVARTDLLVGRFPRVTFASGL